MTGKLYTVEEANALLPHIAPALVELREKFEEAVEIRATVARIGQGNGWSSDRDEWAATVQRVAELLERFQKWEVEIKDVGTGLVDFPTVMEGEDAYLCWRLGEAEVAHWHTIEGGFAGRRRL